MSAKQLRPPGRPASGITKAKPGITIDRKLMLKAKKAAFRENLSFSAYVERAIVNFLSTAAEP